MPPIVCALDVTYRRSELWLSSLKLALIAALSFCTTARSSAMVFAARTLRINCFTAHRYGQHQSRPLYSLRVQTYESSLCQPRGRRNDDVVMYSVSLVARDHINNPMQSLDLVAVCGDEVRPVLARCCLSS